MKNLELRQSADSELTEAFTAITLHEGSTKELKLQRKLFKRKVARQKLSKLFIDPLCSSNGLNYFPDVSKLSSFSQLSYHSDSEVELSTKRKDKKPVRKSDTSAFPVSKSFQVGQYSSKGNRYTRRTTDHVDASEQRELLSATETLNLQSNASTNGYSKSHEKCNSATCNAETSCQPKSCLTQARHAEEIPVDELAAYFDEIVHLPRKMCRITESMYA
ncbi:uncharacterized protein LOC142336816 [Convolutriloba macropyga]|uniref:uncharacterized protein LOC142336816 n=1 Tax=Convolutriloba macropyga TaxID=536237 RepID=UPI003F51BAB5